MNRDLFFCFQAEIWIFFSLVKNSVSGKIPFVSSIWTPKTGEDYNGLENHESQFSNSRSSLTTAFISPMEVKIQTIRYSLEQYNKKLSFCCLNRSLEVPKCRKRFNFGLSCLWNSTYSRTSDRISLSKISIQNFLLVLVDSSKNPFFSTVHWNCDEPKMPENFNSHYMHPNANSNSFRIACFFSRSKCQTITF